MERNNAKHEQKSFSSRKRKRKGEKKKNPKMINQIKCNEKFPSRGKLIKGNDFKIMGDIINKHYLNNEK